MASRVTVGKPRGVMIELDGVPAHVLAAFQANASAPVVHAPPRRENAAPATRRREHKPTARRRARAPTGDDAPLPRPDLEVRSGAA